MGHGSNGIGDTDTAEGSSVKESGESGSGSVHALQIGNNGVNEGGPSTTMMQYNVTVISADGDQEMSY